MSKEKKQKNWNKEGEKQVEKKEENENKKIDTTLGEDEIETSEQVRNLSGFVRYLFLAIAVI